MIYNKTEFFMRHKPQYGASNLLGLCSKKSDPHNVAWVEGVTEQTNFQGSNNIDCPGKCDKNWASVLSLVNTQESENQIFNSFALLL